MTSNLSEQLSNQPEQGRSLPEGAAAVVVGGSRGIGLAIGRSLGLAGFRVLLASRDSGALARAAAELRAERVDVSWAAGDISTSDGAARLCDDIVQERHASPLVLVYAAGVFGPIASIAGSPIEEWRSVIDTNLLGAFYTTRLLLPHMLAAGWGRIVYVSSKAAIGQPGGGASAYAISKIGLNRLSSEVAAEVAGHGVTANSIHPGEVKTAMWADITDKARRAGDVGEGLGQWSEMVARTGGDPVSLSARMVMWLVGHPEVNGEFLLPEEWERSVDGGDL